MSRSKRHARLANAILVILVLIGGAFLGGRMSVTEVSEAFSVPPVIGVPDLEWKVEEASTGRKLKFSGSLSMPILDGPVISAEGVVTALPSATDGMVDLNTVIMEIDLRPVVAGVGSVPSFRDIAEGDKGSDVSQLRAFLCSVGNLKECRENPLFTPAMGRAVSSWQKSLGVPPDGTLHAGDIMWLEELPVRVNFAKEFVVGSVVTADQRPVQIVSGVPTLDLQVSAEQAALVPVGATFTLGERTSGVFVGVGSQASKDERLSLDLRGADGVEDVCSMSSECMELLGENTTLPVEIVIQVAPEVTGPSVPSRAVMSKADGSTYVILKDGSHYPISVVGGSGGLLVVNGIDVGSTILVGPPDGS